MKIKATLLFLLLFTFSSFSFAQQFAGLVKADTLKKYLRELTGDMPTVIDGNTYTITTRNTINLGSNYIAANYIKYRLKTYGLTVTEQPFTFTYYGNNYQAKNIYAVQTGKLYPNKKLIICAHFDNMPSAGIAPGADDNGTGTCAVLEAARVISKLNTNYTIVYALWSGEEQGLKGSAYYANLAYSSQEDIQGVINMDMIGWDDVRNNDLAVYDALPASLFITDKLSSVNAGYGINLTLSKYATPMMNSDNYSFYYKGYPTICMIENDYAVNNHYHSAEDKYANINTAYYEKCASLAIYTLAELAGAAVPNGTEKTDALPSSFTLYQNYPNPFNPATTIKYSVPKPGAQNGSQLQRVTLKIYDLLGREVASLADGYKAPGTYSVQYNAGSLSNGIYFSRLTAGGYSAVRKMILLK